MKTIGLLGGMSWQSTLDYYKQINKKVNTRLGGFHSAKMTMVSVDFAGLESAMGTGNWEFCATTLIDAALSVEGAGADCLLICTNTLHKVAPQVEEAINIPLLHIADGAGQSLVKNNISAVGLLGTRFTMEEDFYSLRLAEKYGLQVFTPNSADRATVDNIIFNELCQGEINTNSQAEYLRIMDDLRNQGAEAILLGCTEIAMLVSENHTDIPLFDTTAIHTSMAVDFSLS
ncbi:aspartate/glutamate racemase family protein [Desulforhopalus sp. 52FAK]